MGVVVLSLSPTLSVHWMVLWVAGGVLLKYVTLDVHSLTHSVELIDKKLIIIGLRRTFQLSDLLNTSNHSLFFACKS